MRIVGRLTLTGFTKLGFQINDRYKSFNLFLNFGATFNISF